jgi:serine/threonine protein kinase
MVLPWMPGGTLTQRIQKRILTLWEINNILERIASALATLHKRGFIHRDVKPQNILFDSEELAYLSDFGIVKPIQKDPNEEPVSRTGTIAGTPGYMSPEQMFGGLLQPASDVYSLGVVLFEMLTGEALYENGKEAYRKSNEPIPDILKKRPELPPACQEILAKSLAPNAQDRYHTTTELADIFSKMLERNELHQKTIVSSASSPETLLNQIAFVHPFVYEHPIQPERFVGQNRLVDDILQLVRNKQSIMISGLPHIGKSSLLLKLKRELDQSTNSPFITNLINLNQVAGDYEPQRFWDRSFSPLLQLTNESLTQAIIEAQDNNFDPRFLQRIFWLIHDMNKQLVILVDNFERLLDYRSFKEPEFFATLRGFLTTGDLNLIITSRLREQDIRREARGLFDLGSMFFNPFINKKLGALSSQSVIVWFDKYKLHLTGQDAQYIYQEAGHHPFLLQIIAVASTANTNTATENVIQTHFEELWVSLENSVRGLLLAFVLIESRTTSTELLFHNSPRNQMLFLPMLQEMALDGLVRPAQLNSLLDENRMGLILGNNQWLIDARRFTQWLHEHILLSTPSKQLIYSKWFENDYQNWINRSVWDQAITTIRRQGSGFSMYGTKY